MEKEKIKSIAIGVMAIIMVVIMIKYSSAKKNKVKIEVSELMNNVNTTNENGGVLSEVDEVDSKYIEASNKISEYQDNLLNSRMSASDKQSLINLRKEVAKYKNSKDENGEVIDNTEQRKQAQEKLKNKNKELVKKYVKSAENKKMNTYLKKLDKIGEKYEQYQILRNQINGGDSSKLEEFANLKVEILEELANLGELN